MKRIIGAILCAIGAHDYRERKNGSATERVCMRHGCEKRETLYALKEGKAMLWKLQEADIERNARDVSLRR